MTTQAPGRVAFLDLAAAHAELSDELDAALARVAAGGRYVLGPEVEAFEERFAAAVGTRHCVGVGCGLDALHLALVAAGVGPGDEVLVPATTYIATWLAVTLAGAAVVPVEPDPRTGNIDPDRLESAVTPRTRAIVPVHLYGLPARMDEIRAVAGRRGLRVIEDAAQAHGARHRGRPVGGLGDAAAWSFYPGKNLGAIGDGGAVTTDDDALARRLRRLRNYGATERYVHPERGVNSRLDELQAAVLSVKLEHLERWNARRARIAGLYLAGLAGSPVTLPAAPAEDRHAWHVFAIRSDRRDALAGPPARRGRRDAGALPGAAAPAGRVSRPRAGAGRPADRRGDRPPDAQPADGSPPRAGGRRAGGRGREGVRWRRLNRPRRRSPATPT